MNELRFDDRVAIVTGAGGGLGRSHSLALAALGAKVVVNDPGVDASGVRAADSVVAEIKSAGGEAIANYESVTDGEKIVQTAIDTWGSVDIVVNNAGILRDTSFTKMTEEQWDLVLDVHLKGSMSVTKAAWPYMLEKKYGRIVVTSSAAAIYGNFGQPNYAAAKAGLIGFMNTLAIEGAKKNIHINTLVPSALSRMTENLLPKEMADAMKPEYVSPLVAWLCHENCTETKGIFEAGAGCMAKYRWERSGGFAFGPRDISIEDVARSWDKITDFTNGIHPAGVEDAMAVMMRAINNA